MSMGQDRKTESRITVYIDPGLEEIVPGFLENRRRDVQKVETALGQDDLNTICVIGHRMRGDGGGYGLDAISTIGEGMEQAAARQDKEAIRRHLSSLVDFLARITVVYRK
jgi:HPt (histidine-containing phosphotransfer) domain-containing protein